MKQVEYIIEDNLMLRAELSWIQMSPTFQKATKEGQMPTNINLVDECDKLDMFCAHNDCH